MPPAPHLTLVWDADAGAFTPDAAAIAHAPMPPRAILRRRAGPRAQTLPLVRLRNLLTPYGWALATGVILGLVLASLVFTAFTGWPQS